MLFSEKPASYTAWQYRADRFSLSLYHAAAIYTRDRFVIIPSIL